MSWIFSWRLWKWFESGRHPKLHLGALSNIRTLSCSVRLVWVLWLWTQCIWHSFDSVEYLFRPGFLLGLMAIFCQRHFWICDKSFWSVSVCLADNFLLGSVICMCLGHLKIDQEKWFWFCPKLLHHLLSRRTILLLVPEERKRIELFFEKIKYSFGIVSWSWSERETDFGFNCE